MLHHIRVRFAAVAALTILGAAGVAWLPTAHAAEVPVTGGTLRWGVKESFRTYVTGPVSLGSIATHSGASANSDGTYNFPFAAGGTYDSDPEAVNAPHVGGVKFTGHLGTLDIDIYNLRVKTTGNGVFLFADAKSRPFEGLTPSPVKTYSNVPIVKMNLAGANRSVTGNQQTFGGVSTVLTKEGVPVFGGFYAEGTAFDPLGFTLITSGAEATSTTSTTAQTSSTTSTTSDPSTTTTSSTSTTVAPTTTTSTSTTVAPTTTTTAPPTSAIDAPTTGSAITSGFLDWGVKTSFRNYVKSPTAKGAVTVAAPATLNTDESTRFPLAGTTGRRDAASNRTGAGFGGSIRYVGHEGQLDLKVADPRIAFNGNQGTLVVDIVSRALGSTEERTFDDVTLASLDLSGITPTTVTNGLRWTAVPATLTSQGAPAFGGFYTAGTALDPISVTIGLTGQVETPPPATNPPPTISLSGTPRLGGTMGVGGDGFVGGEQVQVAVLSTPRVLATVTAAANGSVSTVVTLPSDLEAGSHQIRLIGLTSNRTVLSAAFNVAAAPTSNVLVRTGQNVMLLALVGVTFVSIGLPLARLRRSRGAGVSRGASTGSR